MNDEIEECLDIVTGIRKEPMLISNRSSSVSDQQHGDSDIMARKKTVDGMKLLENAIVEAAPAMKRRPFSDVRHYLCQPKISGGPLKLASLDIISDFVSLYEHARYDPGPFTEEKLEEYNELLKQLLYSYVFHLSSKNHLITHCFFLLYYRVKAISGHRPSSTSDNSASSVIASVPTLSGGIPEERVLKKSSTVRQPLLADTNA